MAVIRHIFICKPRIYEYEQYYSIFLRTTFCMHLFWLKQKVPPNLNTYSYTCYLVPDTVHTQQCNHTRRRRIMLFAVN